jgi:vacuolar-type H+-ATPase subunit E/Vma4
MGEETDPAKLIDAIEARAGEERAKIRAEAEARAKEIQAGADAEIQRMKAEAGRGLEKELAAEAQRLLGKARIQTRGEQLQMKRRILAEAFQRARKEIETLSRSKDCPAALEVLAAEAKAAVGEPCAVEIRREEGTVKAISRDGRRRADNSLLSRLGKAASLHESEVARILFGAKGSP